MTLGTILLIILILLLIGAIPARGRYGNAPLGKKSGKMDQRRSALHRSWLIDVHLPDLSPKDKPPADKHGTICSTRGAFCLKGECRRVSSCMTSRRKYRLQNALFR